MPIKIKNISPFVSIKKKINANIMNFTFYFSSISFLPQTDIPIVPIFYI